MENILKTIEESEDNNPLLTAALEEIKRLNVKLEDVKSVAFGSDFYYSDDDEPQKLTAIAVEDLDKHRVSMIQSLIID